MCAQGSDALTCFPFNPRPKHGRGHLKRGAVYPAPHGRRQTWPQEAWRGHRVPQALTSAAAMTPRSSATRSSFAIAPKTGEPFTARAVHSARLAARAFLDGAAGRPGGHRHALRHALSVAGWRAHRAHAQRRPRKPALRHARGRIAAPAVDVRRRAFDVPGLEPEGRSARPRARRPVREGADRAPRGSHAGSGLNTGLFVAASDEQITPAS